jgi:hypothetical protein
MSKENIAKDNDKLFAQKRRHRGKSRRSEKEMKRKKTKSQKSWAVSFHAAYSVVVLFVSFPPKLNLMAFCACIHSIPSFSGVPEHLKPLCPRAATA